LQNSKQPEMNFPTKLNNFSLFSLSEKSERDLPTSERENGWWIAYRSIYTVSQKSWPFLFL